MPVSVRGQTIEVAVEMVTEECCYNGCGVLWSMTADFIKERRKDKKMFYCPNGHGQSYSGDTEADRLRKQLNEERRQRQSAEQRVAYWQDEAKEAKDKAEHERHRANGYKGHATRITKRVKAGVCICCNRTFKNLASHMATKHPQLTPQDSVEEPIMFKEDANA